MDLSVDCRACGGAVYYMNMPKEHSEEGFLIRRESEDCADGIRENALY